MAVKRKRNEIKKAKSRAGQKDCVLSGKVGSPADGHTKKNRFRVKIHFKKERTFDLKHWQVCVWQKVEMLQPQTQPCVATLCRLHGEAEHFLSAALDQRTGRNDGGVRKGSGRAVTIYVQPRYYLYLRLSSGTDVTHHPSSLLPRDVTLSKAHP